MTIEEFIEARIAEDEQAAARASIEYEYETWTASEDSVSTITNSNIAHTVEATYNSDVADHIARHDPARAMRQCAAIRELINVASDVDALYSIAAEDAADSIRRTIAAIWSDHPDYRQEWSA
jgi:hypothetical protein